MIEVAGQTKHVTSYLRDFMFDDVKMTQRVSTLSGGKIAYFWQSCLPSHIIFWCWTSRPMIWILKR